MIYRIYFILIIYTFANNIIIYPITFNVSFINKAIVDIEVYKQQPTSPTSLAPFTINTPKVIARYSFAVNSVGNVLLWKNTCGEIVLNVFIHPEDHFMLPTEHSNPFVVELTVDELHCLSPDITQAYVVIAQRTYQYRPDLNTITFFDYSILKAGFVALNAIIDIEASGLINPTKFAEVPIFLQPLYPIASGSAT